MGFCECEFSLTLSERVCGCTFAALNVPRDGGPLRGAWPLGGAAWTREVWVLSGQTYVWSPTAACRWSEFWNLNPQKCVLTLESQQGQEP